MWYFCSVLTWDISPVDILSVHTRFSHLKHWKKRCNMRVMSSMKNWWRLLGSTICLGAMLRLGHFHHKVQSCFSVFPSLLAPALLEVVRNLLVWISVWWLTWDDDWSKNAKRLNCASLVDERLGHKVKQRNNKWRQCQVIHPEKTAII